jgi:hypothetical protein
VEKLAAYTSQANEPGRQAPERSPEKLWQAQKLRMRLKYDAKRGNNDADGRQDKMRGAGLRRGDFGRRQFV